MIAKKDLSYFLRKNKKIGKKTSRCVASRYTNTIRQSGDLVSVRFFDMNFLHKIDFSVVL